MKSVCGGNILVFGAYNLYSRRSNFDQLDCLHWISEIQVQRDLRKSFIDYLTCLLTSVKIYFYMCKRKPVILVQTLTYYNRFAFFSSTNFIAISLFHKHTHRHTHEHPPVPAYKLIYFVIWVFSLFYTVSSISFCLVLFVHKRTLFLQSFWNSSLQINNLKNILLSVASEFMLFYVLYLTLYSVETRSIVIREPDERVFVFFLFISHSFSLRVYIYIYTNLKASELKWLWV